MVSRQKFIDTAVSDELLLGLCVFIAGFMLLQVSGMTALAPDGAMQALHRPPALAAVALLCIQGALRTAVLMKDRAAAATAGGRMTPALLFHLGLILATAGILLSSFTRFEGTMVLAEGQVSGRDGVGYSEGSVSLRKFAVWPDVEIEMLDIKPTFYRSGRSLWNVTAQMRLGSRKWTKATTISCNSLFPSFIAGTLMRVTNFGYAPHYQISDPSGEVLDEAYAILKLFPPGSEDSFSMTFLPITFYVRYFPDGIPWKEKSPASDDRPPGPAYLLRASRNLDLILYTSALAPAEKASIGPEMISLLDVVRWAEIRIVRDSGLFLLLPGGCVALAAVAWGRISRRGSVWIGGWSAFLGNRRPE